jgi:hypothetical protein
MRNETTDLGPRPAYQLYDDDHAPHPRCSHNTSDGVALMSDLEGVDLNELGDEDMARIYHQLPLDY